jgi:hypothetical protein
LQDKESDMSAVLRTISLAVFVAVAYGAGRADTGHTAPCRRGLL